MVRAPVGGVTPGRRRRGRGVLRPLQLWFRRRRLVLDALGSLRGLQRWGLLVLLAL